MNTPVARILTILLLALLAFGAAADQAEKPPQGQGRYLVVLWHPGTPVPGKEQDRMRTVQEPNVAALGGRVVASHANRRVVFLPHAAAKELRRHEAVSYVQRIWTGEPFSEWKQTAAATSSDAAASRPQRIASDSDQFTWSKDYSYNADGNITHIGTSSSGFDEFAYDGVGRLTEAVVNGAPETYTYDAFGNLTGFARPTGGRSIPVDPATNRLVGVNHDAAGNITNRTGREGYAYDPLNMMVLQYESTPGGDRRILYDANDERIGSTYGASSQRWTIRDFNGQILREFTSLELALYADWHWEQDHIRGEGQLIAGDSQVWHYNPEPASPILWGGERHYHLDHLGSVRIVTNEDGKALAEHDFFPFGATRTKQHQEQLNFAHYHTDGMRFAGHWRDFMGNPNVENDDYLDYMHARYYDPHLGRFLSVDPTWESADLGRPQSWNRYSYVVNNPVNLTDPDGKCPWCIALDVVSELADGGGLDPEPRPDIERARAQGAHVTEGASPAERARYTQEIKADRPYQRPSGATTPQQRASVQNKPCEVCGKDDGGKRVAGHKKALVQEHYETGTVDKQKMRSLDAVRPECPTCSAKEGAAMSRYSREMKEKLIKLFKELIF